jgi:hypothetical protein
MRKGAPRVFAGINANGFELCQPDNGDDWDLVAELINGAPRAKSWRPLGVHLVRVDEGVALRPADAPWFGGHALVLRERAIDAMEPMLTAGGELLPLRSVGDRLWMYNPTVALDALDESASTIMRLADGRIMYIQKYAFHSDIVRGVPVFKIANLKREQSFYGPEFVARWRKAKLTGLKFYEVWCGGEVTER